MKRLAGILLAAVITVTLLTWSFGGDDFQLSDKQWHCQPDGDAVRCKLSLRLVSLADHALQLRIGIRPMGQHPQQVPNVQGDTSWQLMLGPGEERLVQREFVSSEPWHNVLISAMALKSAP